MDTKTEAILGQKTILIVDDTPDNLSLLNAVLKDFYKIKVAISGEKAIKIACSEDMPDLILLDIMMPDMDGYEVCRILKSTLKTKHIPIIFLTAKTEEADEKKGFELGAVDYITKPISIPILMARVSTHLKLKAAADFLKDKTVFLEQEVHKRTAEIHAIQDVTILSLASLAETRDLETGNHIRRTQLFVKILANRLKDNPKYTNILTDNYIETLYKSAPLHDIGKVGIPDRILLKPSKLTPEEFEIMKTHTIIGYSAIEKAEKQLNISVDFLTCSKEIAYYHQEKWDGSGYPDGINGNTIPISVRIMAVADVYDALTSKRIYKESMTNEEATKIILEGRGKHFDPDVVDAFIDVEEEFKLVYEEYVDDYS